MSGESHSMLHTSRERMYCHGYRCHYITVVLHRRHTVLRIPLLPTTAHGYTHAFGAHAYRRVVSNDRVLRYTPPTVYTVTFILPALTPHPAFLM